MSKTITASTSVPKKEKSVSPFREGLGRFLSKKSAVVGAALLLIVVVLTILAPVIAPYNFAKTDISNMYGAPSAQHIFGYLPREVQQHVAGKMAIPESAVSGVVSFYNYFTTKPKGKYVIDVCLGTAC